MVLLSKCQEKQSIVRKGPTILEYFILALARSRGSFFFMTPLSFRDYSTNIHTNQHRSSFTMSTPRTQLVRRLSTVGGRIIRGEKKAAPEEPAFTSHSNAATTLHRRKLRQSQTQIVRQQDGEKKFHVHNRNEVN
jgi:hypothetical protein